jgi:hypothetical protein
VAIGDSTPYYLFHPLVPERLHETLPEAKLIVLLRNPSRRAISHYFHNVKRGREPLSLYDALRAEEERLDGEVERIMNDPAYYSSAHEHFSYCARGMYYDQIERWTKLFPADHFLFIRSEQFSRDPQTSFAAVCGFLDIPVVPLVEYKRREVGRYGEISQDALDYLDKIFGEPNRRLSEMLGPTFDFTTFEKRC